MSKQHQVVIRFTGNTTQAEAAMRKLRTEMAAVGAEVTKVDNTVKKAAQGFANVSQVTIKSTASLNDLKHAIRGASTGIIDAGATLDQYKIKTTDLRTRTLSAAEAARKAAVEQARYNKLMNQGAIDAQRLAAATARAATAASANANANALAAIRQGNASTVGVGTTARANATVANAGLSTQAAALRLQSQQAAVAAASSARLQRQQDMQAASAARAAQHASALAIAQARQQAAADRAALAAQRLADANNRAGRSSQDAGGMHGLSAKHVLVYSAAYMAASAAIMGFLATVASVPQLGMKLQATESGLLGVYKNQALVNEQLGFLSRLADEAGVKVTTLRDAYTKFTASAIKAGATVEDAQKQFENYTKTARALNLNDQDFQGMLTAIQQILSKGRIMSEELQGQLGEHIPAAVAIMAKSIKNADGTIGVTTMELRKMMEQGQLTSLEMQRFSDILFHEFSQGYAASINNLSAQTARFSNAWDEVAVTIFKATESIMADVVELSTVALHQLNEALQTTSDRITSLDGKHIRFSVEPKVIEDLGFIERSLTNIEGLLDKSASGWTSAFSKWGASFDKLKASMDFGLDEALLGNTADQFRDYEKVTQNAIQANAALSEGFKVLQKGTDKQAITLKDELAVALRNYNQQAAEMLRQMEAQEATIANLNKSGQSSTGETARLAESKKSYEALMGVLADYADLFVRANQKIGNASNEAKAALNAEAKVAADGVRAAEAEAAADKEAKEAKKAHRQETEIKVEVDRKHADALRKSVEAQLEANLALKGGSAAVEYYKLRLEGLTAAEAKAAVGKQAQVKAEEELKKLRGEQTTSSENILEKYKLELENSGILFTDNFTEAESAAQRAIGYAETFEAKLKAAGDAFKNVTSEVTQYSPSSSGYKGSYQLTAPSTTINKTVAATAKRYGVDPAFAMAIAQRETGYLKTLNRRENAVSPAGALGVMQVMPGTGAQMGYGTKDLTNLNTNIEAGVKYLAQMLKQFNGSETLAAAAYNAGPNRQALREGRVPNIKETQEYVKAVAQYTADFRGQSDKAAASWDEVTEAVGETTSKAKDTVTVTGEYNGKLAEANLSQAELWQQLSSQKLQNAANDLSTEADKQRRSFELSGNALREEELAAQGFTGELQGQVIASEQRRNYAEQNKQLTQEEAAIGSGARQQYINQLGDINLGEQQRYDLVSRKMAIAHKQLLHDLEKQTKQLSLSDDELRRMELDQEGYNAAQIASVRQAEKLLETTKRIREAADKIGDGLLDGLMKAANGSEGAMESWKSTIEAAFADIVLRPTLQPITKAVSAGITGAFTGKSNPWASLQQQFSQTWAGLQQGGVQGYSNAAGVGAVIGGLTGSQEGAIGGSLGSMAGKAIGTALGGSAGGAIGSVIGSAAGAIFGDMLKDDDSARAKFTGGKPTDGYAFVDRGKKLSATSKLGTFGFQADGTHDLGDQGEAQLQELVVKMVKIDDAIAQFIPDSEVARVKDALAAYSKSGLDFDGLVKDRLKIITTGLSTTMQGLIDFSGDADSVITRIDELIAIQQQAVPALRDMSLQIGNTSDSALAAATGLSDIAGGLQSLTSTAGAYYDAVYSEEEQKQIALRNAEAAVAAFNAANKAQITTLASLRAYVEGLDLTQSANYQASLLAMGLADELTLLAPAMAEVVDAVQAAKDAVSQQADIFSQYWGGIEAVTGNYKADLDSLTESYEKQKQAYENALQAATGLREALLGLKLSDLTILTPEKQLAEARNQYDTLLGKAKAGDVEAANKLQNAGETLLRLSREYYASSDSYTADFLATQTGWESVADLLEAQQDPQLAMLDEQRKLLETTEREYSRLSDIFAGIIGGNDLQRLSLAQISSLPTELADQLRGTLEGLRGTSGTAKLNSTDDVLLAVDKADDLADKSAQIISLYQSLLSRLPDTDGFEFWAKALKSGVGLSDIASSIAQSTEYKNSHYDGLASVPYNGYQATLHKGEAVIDARAMFALRKYGIPSAPQSQQPVVVNVDTEGLKAEIIALRSEVSALRSERGKDAMTASSQRDAQIRQAGNTERVLARTARMK